VLQSIDSDEIDAGTRLANLEIKPIAAAIEHDQGNPATNGHMRRFAKEKDISDRKKERV
jgi:hypothetical protein